MKFNPARSACYCLPPEKLSGMEKLEKGALDAIKFPVLRSVR